MATVLITGGHAGIGLTCSEALVSRPDLDLVLAGRSIERMEPVAHRLRSVRGGRVTTLALDLSSLVSIRSAARELRDKLDRGEVAPLSAILCHAGGQFWGPVSYSIDGYEETFATNHLGHFLLVNLLLDQLVGDGRVVFTASGTHDPDTADGRMVGRAVEPDATALAGDGRNAKPLSTGVRYSTSKLCTMLFAYELDRRLRRTDSAAASIAFDPGWIPETGLQRTMPAPMRWLAKTGAVKILMRRMGITQGSLTFSGMSLAQIAVDPAFIDASGKYFQSSDGRLVEQRSSRTSYDMQKAARLWRDSERLVQLRPEERPQLLAKFEPQRPPTAVASR